MFNKIIEAIASSLAIFHHVPNEEPDKTNNEKTVTLHSIKVASTTPRTVLFTGSGSVNGRTGGFNGGEDDTSESVRDIIVRLMRTQPGITNVVVTNPADQKRYDSHRRGQSIVILAEDRSYEEVVNL